MIKVLKNLAFWVVLAIVLGIFVGYAFPQIGTLSKFGIDYFIMILKWMVGPIIFYLRHCVLRKPKRPWQHRLKRLHLLCHYPALG